MLVEFWYTLVIQGLPLGGLTYLFHVTQKRLQVALLHYDIQGKCRHLQPNVSPNQRAFDLGLFSQNYASYVFQTLREKYGLELRRRFEYRKLWQPTPSWKEKQKLAMVSVCASCDLYSLSLSLL